MGTIDANGVFIYDENDPVSPFSDFMNLGQAAQSVALGDLDARVDGLLPVVDWTPLTHNTRFKLYGAGSDGPVRFSRWGRLAHVHGVIGPNDSTAVAAVSGIANTADNLIATLPAGSRPGTILTSVQQGSGSDQWCLTITTGGAMYATRYSGTATTSTWFPFDLTFLVAS